MLREYKSQVKYKHSAKQVKIAVSANIFYFCRITILSGALMKLDQSEQESRNRKDGAF
jgi:hypothetical protein